MEFSQILKSCRSSPSKNYKSLQKFCQRLDFKDIKISVKIRDMHKIGKKDSIGITFFGYENKEKHLSYISKNVVKKNMLIYY